MHSSILFPEDDQKPADEDVTSLGEAALKVVESIAANFVSETKIQNLGNEPRCPECGAYRPLGSPCPTGQDHNRG